MDFPNKLELHYFLENASHSMDARIRNKCEAEIIATVYEVISEFGFEITLDSEAFREGGLKEVWDFLGKNNAQIALIISVLALVYSVVPKTDKELLALQKQELRLSIEEKELSISKIKKELNDSALTQDLINSAEKIVSQNYKVITRRSNFYKQLSTYDKVSQIGVSKLNNLNTPISKEKVVKKSDFKKFILLTDSLPTIIDENATIEIVSPVFIDSNAKWKGIYNGEHINFCMKDRDFKSKVLSKQVGFKRGSNIICVLEVQRKLNEVGEAINSSWNVTTVLEKVDDGVANETQGGKKYRHNKKLEKNQGNLF